MLVTANGSAARRRNFGRFWQIIFQNHEHLPLVAIWVQYPCFVLDSKAAIGLHLVTGDEAALVGGFAGSPTTDLLTRWLEIAAFVPIDRNHTEQGTNDQEPWVGGPEQEAIRRRFIESVTG